MIIDVNRKISFMKNILKYFFIISFGFICLSTNYIVAQEQTPTYQSLIKSGDKAYTDNEFIKAKTYYQEALRLKPNDATAKGKLDNTLRKIREENKKEEQFFEYIDNADALYKAMREMIVNPSLRTQMASVSRGRIAERYEQSFGRKCLYDFYHSIL